MKLRKVITLKRILLSIVMIGLLVGTTICAAYIYDKEGFKESQKEEKQYTDGTVCKPDIKHLDKYGIKSFTSELPVLMIDTGNQQIVKSAGVWGKVGILDRASGNNIAESPDTVLHCTIKLRGASSYSQFDKSQYRLKLFKKKKGGTLNYPLCGMGKNSEWVLYGPFLDKTLIRNSLVYDTARKIMEWAPDSRYIELFVDGRYQGIYLAVEPVTNGESRLRLSTFGLMSGQTAYILKRDRVGTETDVIKTWGQMHGKTINELSIEYPTSSNITQKQKQWITKDISAFEERLYSDDFASFQYEDYIDVDNFVDYFILNEITLNNDGGVLSTYPYKELGGKLKLAVWDFNNAFDNHQWFAMQYDQFHMIDAPWFDQLLKDRDFVEKICQRYHSLRQNELSTKTLSQMIEERQSRLSGALERNYKIWEYVFSTKLSRSDGNEERNAKSYSKAIHFLKQTIKKRLKFMDEHIEDLYEDCEF